jgi:hypothetical protein
MRLSSLVVAAGMLFSSAVFAQHSSTTPSSPPPSPPPSAAPSTPPPAPGPGPEHFVRHFERFLGSERVAQQRPEQS